MSQEKILKTLSLPALPLAFFLSGTAALIYQVAWQRILTFHSGVGTYSVSVIVACFLTGLALGNYLGGIYSSKSSRWHSLRLFIVIEIIIAVLGLCSYWFYYDFLYIKLNVFYGSVASMILKHFAVLILPTTLMGMSFPLLAKATIDTIKIAGQKLSWLNAVNIFGAAFGCLLTTWLIIPYIGIKGVLIFAGVCNFLAALFMYFYSFSIDKTRNPESSEEIFNADSTNKQSVQSGRFKLYLILIFLSGFISLSLEIIWFRIIDVGVKSNSFTFGTFLSIFLLFLGLGSFLGARYFKNSGRLLEWFLGFQSIIVIYTGLSLVALNSPAFMQLFFENLYAYWQGEKVSNLELFGFHILLSLVLCAVPCLMMGLSFSVVQFAIQDRLKLVGKKLGTLLSFNIAGNILGSLLTGILLLELLGTSGSIKLTLALSLVFAFIGLALFKNKIFVFASVLTLALLFILKPREQFWNIYHPQSYYPGFQSELAEGLIFISKPVDNKSYIFYINGKYHSSIPYGNAHTFLGAIGSLIHPNPEKIAIIGLGSGDTAWASAFRKETSQVDVFETVLDTSLLRNFASSYNFSTIINLLDDKRIGIVNEDGRQLLRASDTKYDIIEADALRPFSAYAGNLYSSEYFELCKSKLKSGGMMIQWNCSPNTVKTFSRVFDHVYVMGPALIGSSDPITLDQEALMETLNTNHALEYFGNTLNEFLKQSIQTRNFIAVNHDSLSQGINSDLFPKDEYRLLHPLFNNLPAQ